MAILPIDLTSSRVLLVEDDTLAMDMARTALGALGVTRITLATGGAQALAALDTGFNCELVISDWNMPKFDRLDLLKAVRERWFDVTFLMVTNNENLDHIRAARGRRRRWLSDQALFLEPASRSCSAGPDFPLGRPRRRSRGGSGGPGIGGRRQHHSPGPCLGGGDGWCRPLICQ